MNYQAREEIASSPKIPGSRNDMDGGPSTLSTKIALLTPIKKWLKVFMHLLNKLNRKNTN
jgi:hypothetical protein